MIKEISIDFNEQSIEATANLYHTGDKTLPSHHMDIYNVDKDVFGFEKVSMDNILAHVKLFMRHFNYQTKRFIEEFIDKEK